MGKEKDAVEPHELRELARRVRIVASALDEAERQRLLTYADDLDDQANRTEGKRNH